MVVNTTNIKFNVYYNTSSGNGYNCAIYRATGGGSVQSTNYASNSSGFDYFDNSPSVNDAVYFGVVTRGILSFNYQKFRDIVLNVGTVLDGGTLVWEYYRNDSSWQTLTSVGNGDAMKNAGSQTVTFSPPTDWHEVDIGPGAYAMYVRCRMTNTAGVTEGGAQAASRVQYGTNAIHVHGNVSGSAVTLEDVYDTAVDQSWDVDPQQLENLGGTNQAYYFDCYLEVGSTRTDGFTGYLDLRNDTLIFGDNCLLYSYYDANKIDGGTNENDIFSSAKPTIYTNQTYRCEMTTRIEGKLKLYGFSWFNSYLDAAPTAADSYKCWEISQFGTDDYAADTELIDITFVGFRYVNFQAGSSGSVKNFKLCRAQGLNYPTAGTIEDIKLVNCYYGYRGVGTSGSNIMYGLEFANAGSTFFTTWEMTEDKYVRNPVNLPTLTTTNACRWFGSPLSDNTGKFLIQYGVDVEVVDQDGVAINGAVVDMDPDGSDENSNNFNVSTGANGKITRQYVTCTAVSVNTGAQPLSVLTNYDDFTLTITATGYEDYVYIGALDEPWNFRVSMTPTCAGAGNLNLADDLIKL